MRSILLVLGLMGCEFTPTPMADTGASGQDQPDESENLPPLADAGPDVEVDEQTPVVLTGQGSDPEGPIEQIEWTQLDGPSVLLADPSQLSLRFDSPVTLTPVLLRFSLTVWDQSGLKASDEVEVRVSPVNASPSVDAGSDRVVDAAESVVLQATGVDEDGQVVSYEWSQLQGVAVNLVPVGDASVSLTTPSLFFENKLELNVRVLDNEGAVDEDAIMITVRPANRPPTVDLGPSITVNEQTDVQLVPAVADLDGVVQNIEWQQVTAPSVAFVVSANGSLSFRSPVQIGTSTTVSFRCVVTDDRGAQDTAQIDITVLPVNLSPSVQIDGPSQVEAGAALHLAGIAADTDGTITRYTWSQTSGEPVSLGPTDGQTLTVVAPSLSVNTPLSFSLQVEDNEGATADALTTVSVNALNVVPTIDLGPDLSVDEQSVVHITPITSDPDGAIAHTSCVQRSGPSVRLTSSESVSFTAPIVMGPSPTLLFRCVTTDNAGAQAEDSLSIQVNAVNLRPSVEPIAPIFSHARSLVNLIGVAADDDGSVVRYEWTQTGGPPLAGLSLNQRILSVSLPDTAVEEQYHFSLTVFDNEGASASVQTAINARPFGSTGTLVFGGAGCALRGAQTIELSASMPDSIGVIEGYSWRQVSGPPLTLASTTSPTLTVNVPSATVSDRYVFELTALDSFGDQIVGTTTVSVIANSAGVWTPPHHVDLELNDGGLFTPGSLWQHGAPTSGPKAAHSGQLVWATNLSGKYAGNADEILELPLMDLTGVNASLSFRLWSNEWLNDGLHLERFDQDLGWVPLTPVIQPYDGRSGGTDSWNTVGYQGQYALVAVPLKADSGCVARLRFRFQSSPTLNASGAYLDDIRLVNEAIDQDGDGLAGVVNEYLLAGTNPYVADSDGDGALDGDEWDLGTGPMDPADYPSGPVLDSFTYLNFDSGADGLATADTLPESFSSGVRLWEWGSPVGTMSPYSGTSVWGTNLTGGAFSKAAEALNLPPIDLSQAVNPTLSFRIWSADYVSDGTRLERWDGLRWVPMTPDFGDYDGKNGVGEPAWTNMRYRDQFLFSAFSLSQWVGQRIHLRFVFRSSPTLEGKGTYLDDLSILEEGVDHDNDGLKGVLNELLQYGTDPFVSDSDGDGESDGAEVAAGTLPMNPSDFSGASPLLMGQSVDFESGPSGFSTPATAPSLARTGTLWQHGQPANQVSAFSGTQLWATGLSTNYFEDAREHLMLPLIDLTQPANVKASLVFRLWMRTWGSQDGLVFEVYDPAKGWLRQTPVVLPYDGTDPWRAPAWSDQRYQERYVFAGFDLAAFSGQVLQTRFSFFSSHTLQDWGAFIDDVGLYDESVDGDGDGLTGVITEFLLAGTNPFAVDSDGDGVGDGVEVADGTDPLDPSQSRLAVALVPPFLLDFESTDGGLVSAPLSSNGASTGALWSHGLSTIGPGAWSGAMVWATNLLGDYPANAVEYLSLPPIDLSNTVEPTLSFRLFLRTWGGGDTLAVEHFVTGQGWQNLSADVPVYDDASGRAWAHQESFNSFVFAALSLAPLPRDANTRLRFVFRSSPTLPAIGAYLDDLAVADELRDDPDSDGIPGILNELQGWGTDPFLLDSDGDGAADGAEVSAGTDPMNPSDFPGVSPLVIGSFLNFEGVDDGVTQPLLVPNTLVPWPSLGWTRGQPTSGPSAASLGAEVWATGLTGNYASNLNAALYLPPIDLAGTIRPALTFDLWVRAASTDGLQLQRYDALLGWIPLSSVSPAYDAVDFSSEPVWGVQGMSVTYQPIVVDLSTYVGGRVSLRFVFRSDRFYQQEGAYLDAFTLVER